MPNNSYSERQIEVENMLSSVAQDGVPQGVVDEIVTMVGDAEKRPVDSTQEKESEDVIRMKMFEEKDWRKKAAMMAMLISRKLE